MDKLGLLIVKLITVIDVLARLASGYFALVFALGMLWFASTSYSGMALAISLGVGAFLGLKSFSKQWAIVVATACVLLAISGFVSWIYSTNSTGPVKWYVAALIGWLILKITVIRPREPRS